MATKVSPELIKALAGSPAVFDSQGLEQPMIDPIMLGAQMAPGLARIGATLAGRAVPAFNALGEAGALFPKRPGIPVKQPSIHPSELLTPAERQYKLWEMTEKQYLANNDFANALRAKWGMAKNVGGN